MGLKLLKSLVFIAGLGAWPALQAENRSNDTNVIGKEVLAKIKKQLKIERQTHGAMRILEMTDTCAQFPLVGRTNDDVNNILKAAGQKFNLQPNTGSTSKPNQLVGGMVLETDGFAYSAAFNIVLHTTNLKAGTIDSVVYCNVLTRSL